MPPMDGFQKTPEKRPAAKNEGTPCTPTPTKLFRNLNIKTPDTEIKKSLFAADCDRKKRSTESPDGHKPLSLRYDRRDSRQSTAPREEQKERESVPQHLRSWQDIEITPKRPSKGGAAAKGSKEGGVSAFDELRKRTLSLPLPLKWTVLLQKFNALESTLALYQRKNMFFVHYQSIANAVRQICKKQFVHHDLQEIISIVPDFYHLQWTPFEDKVTKKKGLRLTLTAMDYDPYSDRQIQDPFHRHNDNDGGGDDAVQKEKDRRNEIGVRFLKVSKLKEREKVMRVRLVQYLEFHHRQFLADNVLVEFDALETGRWHRRFDLEHVADIELSPLPQREKKGADDIEKMIAEQKRKMDDIVRKELERAKEAEALKQELQNDPMMGKAMVVPKHLSHLSPTMMARIRAKTKGKSMKNIVTAKTLLSAKEKAADDKEHRLQQLPYLVTLIRGIYVSARKSSMACDDLIALIRKRHRNHHVQSAEIWEQLQIIATLKARFFLIKQGPMVKVAKLNKKVRTKEVLDEIQQKIKKCHH